MKLKVKGVTSLLASLGSNSLLLCWGQTLSAVAGHYGVDPLDYCGFRSTAVGRDLAAFLCRRYSGVTLFRADVELIDVETRQLRKTLAPAESQHP